ncbi:hypothetical protein VFPPC_06045 [Pochonia chlamydosporia 170]|uniref:Uncharacterized protein n=1 Tax=Pochonia chlamydosporia 170 TaxID=1380566 RepID=A0A179FH39_METCM|nr:hypothetical protein VFPPC_06045 [Pochonia chlamydosporia 170]OAQ64832.1 hypothetical protein VFPPC_06045 [Pochonia chlamydosporia 170]
MASTAMKWAQWEPTIRDMVAAIRSRAHSRESQHPLIGTIRGPFAAGKTMVIPPWVYNNLKDSRIDAKVVHVSTQLETAVLIKGEGKEGDSLSGTIPIKRESYGEFLNTLRAGLTNVRTDTPPGHRQSTWLNPQVLPPNIVIFVEEDSSLSAQFCLLLVELIGWADTLTQSHGRSISVSIFVIGQQFVLQGVKIPRKCGQVHGRRVLQPDAALGSSRMATHLQDLGETPHRIAVICFPPWSRVIGLEDICTTRYQVDELTHSEDLAVFNAVDGPSGPPTLQLICLPYEFRAPVQIGGFDRAFILVSPHVQQTILDGRTGHLADGSFHIFPEQEMEQASWANRFTCPSSSVTVFRDRTRPWNARDAERRVLVGDGQLAGFLAALSNLDFRSSPAGKYAMDVFIVDRTTRRDRLRQLNQMGICRVSDKLEFCSDYGLSGTTRSAFYDLLPMFDYDPRLALFVALPCSDLAVINVKIQLAAMIKIGVRKLIQLRMPADIDHKQFHANLVRRYCSGYTARHASLGSLWALLAIWK